MNQLNSDCTTIRAVINLRFLCILKEEKTRLSITQIMIIVIQQSKINKKLSFAKNVPMIINEVITNDKLGLIGDDVGRMKNACPTKDRKEGPKNDNNYVVIVWRIIMTVLVM